MRVSAVAAAVNSCPLDFNVYLQQNKKRREPRVKKVTLKLTPESHYGKAP
jgi:hypothetical protein